MKTTRYSVHSTLAAALCLAAVHEARSATTLLSDDFEIDRSANWNVFEGSGNGVPDYKVEWAYDYSQTRVTVNGTTFTLPQAPNSPPGATRGVRVSVNKNDDVAQTAAVNLYPKTHFSGNFAVRFDMWINYVGGRYGGTGSTEFAIFGVNHLGTQVNWPPAATAPLPASDGVWFAVTGEAGANGDYRSFEGDPAGSPLRVTGGDGGFLDRNGDGVTEFEAVNTLPADHPLNIMFPSPPFETPAVPGKSWIQAEVRQVDGVITWLMNGYVIAQRPAPAEFTEGTLMLGTMDIFASIATPKEDNWVIFDNLRVVGLTAEDALPVVQIVATDAEAQEPGGNDAVFTISRTGPTTQPLEVKFSYRGTATPGVDFATNALSVVIPAEATSVDLPIVALDDRQGEQPETVTVALVPSPKFELATGIAATATIQDDGDVTLVTVARADAHSYERVTEDTLGVTLNREGDLSADLTVNLQFGGTATSGGDYENPGASVVIPAGQAQATIAMAPIDDLNVEGDETIEVTVLTGTGYAVGTPGTATLTLRDNDLAPATSLYSEAFESNVAADWNLTFGAGTGPADYFVEFGYDYSLDGLPPAPNGTATTRGIKATVNKDTTASAAAVNLYPKNRVFSGNYAVRFDMWVGVNLSVAASTEHGIFGINHSGTVTNRHGAAGGDGLWFAVETDGSASSGRSYVSYVGNAAAAPAFVARPAGDFAAVFTKPPYAAAGAASGQWVDVEVSQVGTLVTWKINGATILTRTNDTAFTSGTLLLGHMDTFNSIGAPENATYFDNLRVVRLESVAPPTPAEIKSIQVNGANVVIRFTGTAGATYRLQGMGTVNGTWADETGATVTGSGTDYTATVAAPAGGQRFYRVSQP